MQEFIFSALKSCTHIHVCAPNPHKQTNKYKSPLFNIKPEQFKTSVAALHLKSFHNL